MPLSPQDVDAEVASWQMPGSSRAYPTGHKLTPQDVDAEVASWTPPEDKTAAPHPLATPAGTPPDPIQAAQVPPPGPTTPSYLDSVVSFVDKYRSRVSDLLVKAGAESPLNRPVRDFAAGVIKGAVNVADSAKSLLTAGPAVSETADENGSLTATEDKTPAPDPSHPIYDDARKAILGVRDAIAVKDPTLADNLIEGFGQFAGPFAMYSRAIGSLGMAAELAGGGEAAITSFGSKAAAGAAGVAKFAAADAATNATANAPHDPRIADLLSLHNTAEGKFHNILNAVSPDGSLVRRYLDYIASPDVSEADGRWKNVLDGFNVAAAITGVLHVGAGTLRAGWNALHHMADNNMGSMGDLMPPAPPAPPPAPAEPVAALPAPSGTTPAAALTPADIHNNAVTSMVSRNLQKQNAAKGTSSLTDTIEDLHAHLDESTPSGAFYKDILGRLKSKNLDTTIVPSGTGVHKPAGSNGLPNAGTYFGKDDTVAFHPNGLTGGSDKLLHTVSHEAVHAVTYQAVKTNPAPFASLLEDMKNSNVIGALKKADRYGLTNPLEMVAEAEANPRFQAAMKDAPSASGKGTLWDDYKKLIGTTLGVGAATMASPLFDKLLTKENTGA